MSRNCTILDLSSLPGRKDIIAVGLRILEALIGFILCGVYCDLYKNLAGTLFNFWTKRFENSRGIVNKKYKLLATKNRIFKTENPSKIRKVVYKNSPRL